MLGLVFAKHDFLAGLELLRNRQAAVDADRSGAARIAEQAARFMAGAAAIGAGKARIHGNLVYPSAEALFEMCGKGMVRFFTHGPTMTRSTGGDKQPVLVAVVRH